METFDIESADGRAAPSTVASLTHVDTAQVECMRAYARRIATRLATQVPPPDHVDIASKCVARRARRRAD
eukprot:7698080-Pyramimonas_sp.AAC.1